MTPAEQVVRARLASGPIGFDVFMDIALYDPDVGFYATAGRAGGRAGDFITNPETGPLFGALVGRYLDRVWHDLGEPGDFTFVDVGAGPGTLARTVLAAEPDCLDSLQMVCVEVSAAQRALHPDRVETRADLFDEPITGVVFANELLDNLPVRVVEFADSAWHECCVDLVDEHVVMVPTTLDQRSRERCEALLPDVEAGTRVPLVDAAGSWLERARSALERGRVVVLDYGATTPELADRTMGGWLRTYRGHERGSDPLTAIGEQDITTDVPVDQLPPPDRQTTQAEWLAELGIDDLVDEGRRIWSERAGVGDLEALKARSRINEADALIDPTGLGGFSVLEWKTE